MQEYTAPGAVEVSTEENLTHAMWTALERHPDDPIVAKPEGGGFVELTTRQFMTEVIAVAKGLIATGIKPGDKVCVHSATRLEWAVLDFAIWFSGAVTVPIYETSSAEQIAWIVSDSGARLIVSETPELAAMVGEVRGDLPGLEEVLTITDGALDTLKDRGAEVEDAAVEAASRTAKGADIATIVYTSGTTGRPKGCVITHHNFMWDADQVHAGAPEVVVRGRRTLLFLPLAHIFARVIQTTCLRHGVVLAYSKGIPHLVEELGVYQPDFLLAVPRVFEKVYNGARQKAVDGGKDKIFDKAAHVAEAYSRALDTGGPGLGLKIQRVIFDKLVYGKLRAAMGGKVQYAISGGAALGDRLSHFYRGIGVQILEGYGLTETTAVSCFNRPSALRMETVGRPLPGGSVKIAEDGEILLKGAHIFSGYFNNPEATAEVLDDEGWFRSGDLGTVDGEGYVKITGRKKELLVTAGGKNVAPAVLEDRMRSHALVSQSMVIGDGQPFIAALITIDPDAFPVWAAANGKEGKTVADLVDDADLRAEVQKAVDEANQAVSKAESIRTFKILPEDFEVGVELSQKMSVKRHVVSEKYQSLIDEIYASVQR